MFSSLKVHPRQEVRRTFCKYHQGMLSLSRLGVPTIHIRSTVQPETMPPGSIGLAVRQASSDMIKNHKSRIQRVSRLIRCQANACRSAVPNLPALMCRQHNRNPTPVRSPMSSSVCPNAVLKGMQQGNCRLCRVQSVQRACRSCKSEGRRACLHACLYHVFLEIPGAERMRNALSVRH